MHDVRCIGEARLERAGRAPAKYLSITAASNGKLYAAPWGAKKVIEVLPESSVVREIGEEVRGFCNEFVASANGKLYASPASTGKVVELDLNTSVVREIGHVLESGYTALVAGVSGKLYASPNDEDNPCKLSMVIEVDPYTSEVREIGQARKGMYSELVSGANGKLYASPVYATNAIEVDPDRAEVREIGEPLDLYEEEGDDDLLGSTLYGRLVGCSNGKLFASPVAALKVLEVVPDTAAVREVGEDLDGCYNDFVVGANGKLYASPMGIEVKRKVVELDPEASVTRGIGQDLGRGYTALVAGVNGKLYASPACLDGGLSKVIEVDPNTSMVREIGEALKGSYSEFVAGANGKLYASPRFARNVIEVDPYTAMVREIGGAFPSSVSVLQFSKPVASANEKLYAAPVGAAQVLEINAAVVPSLANHLASVSDAFADVAIVVGAQTFHGHRVVLSRVPFFATVFKEAFAEQVAKKVEIHDVTLDSFRVVWRAMYSDDLACVVNYCGSELIRDVIAAAHRFEMRGLRDAAAERLARLLEDDIVADSVASWLAFARRYGSRTVEELCLSFIKEHGPEVLMAEAGTDWSRDPVVYKAVVEAATGKRMRLC